MHTPSVPSRPGATLRCAGSSGEPQGGGWALTVRPGCGQPPRLERFPAPRREEGSVLIDTLTVGVCGTDREIARGAFGSAPAGQERLVLGHEVLGQVRDAPPGSGLAAGDLVTAVVRRPAPDPCARCAVGDWDMCSDGRYTEHGILGAHGFAREQFRADPEQLVLLPEVLHDTGVLVEPASVVAKGWSQLDRVTARCATPPRTALITGAGPIGLLAALLATQRGLRTYVLDRDGQPRKAELVTALGATFHTGPLSELAGIPDVIVEATGAVQVIRDVINLPAAGSSICLLGVTHTPGSLLADIGALNDHLVHQNKLLFGSVNANPAHFTTALEALTRADPAWLHALITRRVPLAHAPAAFDVAAGDIKTVIDVRPRAA